MLLRFVSKLTNVKLVSCIRMCPGLELLELHSVINQFALASCIKKSLDYF